MNIINFIKIILIILINLTLTNSQSSLDSNEYKCLEILLLKIETIQNVNKNSTIYEFCGVNVNNPPYNVTTILCDETNKYVEILIISQPLGSSAQLFNSDFTCLRNLLSLTLYSPVLEVGSGQFFSPFISLGNIFIETYRTNGIYFSKISSNVSESFFRISTQPQSVLKFSFFNSLKRLQITPPGSRFEMVTNSSHLITFENDLVEKWIVSDLYLMSMNFPSFNYIESIDNQGLNLYLIPGYDKTTLSNIKTCVNLSSIIIRSKDVSPFPTEFATAFQSINNTIKTKKVTFDIPFEKPVAQIIDLSKSEVSELYLNNVGRSFSINNFLPLKISTRVTSFTFNGGNFSYFDMEPFQNIKELDLSDNLIYNSMLSTFDSSFFRSMNKLYIKNNFLTGTIDRSFCSLDLDVSNNSLSNEIPTCFTCFFVGSFLKKKFENNNFTNFNRPPPCTTIIPNIVYLGYINSKHSINVYGNDIGVNFVGTSSLVKEISPGFFCIWGVDVENEAFNCLISTTKEKLPPKIIKYQYKFSTTNYTFDLSWDPSPPQPVLVDWKSSSVNISFEGLFFSYNKSDIFISIGGKGCLVTSSEFKKLNCTLPTIIDPLATKVPTLITVGSLTTQLFTLNPGIVNKVILCNNSCVNGICNSEIGTCECYPNFTGENCTICDSIHQGEDCSFPFKECLNDCNKIGKCNTNNGVCSCPIEWGGVDCSMPSHYVSSVLPSNTLGGRASFFGWFGNVHTDLQVFIGDKPCTPLFSVNETEIICNALPGSGLQTINVTQNSVVFLSKNSYLYYSNIKGCPNDCSSSVNGKCNSTNGFCECATNWYGYDCSLYSNNGGSGESLPISNTTVDDNGNANINNQQTNYQLSITTLLEIDFNGNVINEYPLQNQWSVYSRNGGSTFVYTFVQSIQNYQCNITFTIEQIISDRYISFAGIEYKLNSGSIKMTVSIENYHYSSNLNTLQLLMKSSVSDIENGSGETNKCNDDNVELTENNNQGILNYISIKKDEKVLNGRFLDTVLSDDKPTFSSTVVVSKSNDSIIVGMNIPHCSKCLIDPDFSVLVTPSWNECNSNNSNGKPWLIPVAVVIPIVGLSLIAAILYVVYKKRFVEAPFKAKLKIINNKNNH